ncbi:MAG: alpha/beta hydrolase-fold protein [Bacteroidales bacterium]
MKKFKLISVMLLTVITLAAQYNVINTTHYSPSLNQEKPVKIYLPPDYYTDSTEHYPVIYFLHGAGNDQTSYPGFVSWTQSLINNETIHPVIVVFVNGDCPPYWGSVYANSALYGNYEDYIVYDLVTFIDTTFRTIPERPYRCITGHSMGGGGSAKLAIKHPDIYRGFASHAGIMNFDTVLTLWQPIILQENGGSPTYNYYWGAGTYTNFIFTGAGGWSPNLNNPETFVDFPYDSLGNVINCILMKWKQHDNSSIIKQISPADNLGIFFSCSTEDQHQLYPTNEMFRDTLVMLGLDYTFLTTTGDHNLSPEMIQAGMVFLDSIMFIATGTNEALSNQHSFVVKFSVNPNPVFNETEIIIELTENIITTLDILDMTGKVLESYKDPGKRTDKIDLKINLSGLYPGIYFCRVKMGNEMVTKKIIKVR